jgi:hypothetical protein
MARPADKIAGPDDQLFAALELQWPAALELAGPYLWPAEILQHCDFTPCSRCGSPDSLIGCGMRCMRTVRKVEPDDVYPCGDEVVESVFGIAGWTNRRDDFRVAHAGCESAI